MDKIRWQNRDVPTNPPSKKRVVAEGVGWGMFCVITELHGYIFLDVLGITHSVKSIQHAKELAEIMHQRTQEIFPG
jgi:hypothetical protein